MSTLAFALIILGMTLVTYLPRLIPLLVPGDLPLPPWLDRWLKLIPYAALGALIFPGILTVDAGRPWVGVIGGLAAAATGWLWRNLIATVLVAILVVSVLQ